MSIFERVRKVIVKQLNTEEENVVPESAFLYDLGVDSIDFVSLVMAFEDEFDIDITEETADSLRTVRDVVTYLETIKL